MGGVGGGKGRTRACGIQGAKGRIKEADIRKKKTSRIEREINGLAGLRYSSYGAKCESCG